MTLIAGRAAVVVDLQLVMRARALGENAIERFQSGGGVQALDLLAALVQQVGHDIGNGHDFILGLEYELQKKTACSLMA